MNAPTAPAEKQSAAMPPATITLRIALSPVLSPEDLVRLHQSAELAGQSVEELVVGLIRALPQAQAAA
jgi:hypothetical protein